MKVKTVERERERESVCVCVCCERKNGQRERHTHTQSTFQNLLHVVKMQEKYFDEVKRYFFKDCHRHHHHHHLPRKLFKNFFLCTMTQNVWVYNFSRCCNKLVCFSLIKLSNLTTIFGGEAWT
jgi:hypothetical protein